MKCKLSHFIIKTKLNKTLNTKLKETVKKSPESNTGDT